MNREFLEVRSLKKEEAERWPGCFVMQIITANEGLLLLFPLLDASRLSQRLCTKISKLINEYKITIENCGCLSRDIDRIAIERIAGKSLDDNIAFSTRGI